MKWDGLAELYKNLENLPADLTGEAAHIVEGVANAAAYEIRSAYAQHHHSGNLRDSVFVTHFDKGRYSAGAQVKATAHHAWLFENGSAARAYYTKPGGVRHETGAMPAAHVFIPIMMKHRREMYGQFAALLERNGLSARIDNALAA
jgi:hypothetical protein